MTLVEGKLEQTSNLISFKDSISQEYLFLGDLYAFGGFHLPTQLALSTSVLSLMPCVIGIPPSQEHLSCMSLRVSLFNHTSRLWW